MKLALLSIWLALPILAQDAKVPPSAPIKAEEKQLALPASVETSCAPPIARSREGCKGLGISGRPSSG